MYKMHLQFAMATSGRTLQFYTQGTVTELSVTDIVAASYKNTPRIALTVATKSLPTCCDSSRQLEWKSAVWCRHVAGAMQSQWHTAVGGPLLPCKPPALCLHPELPCAPYLSWTYCCLYALLVLCRPC